MSRTRPFFTIHTILILLTIICSVYLIHNTIHAIYPSPQVCKTYLRSEFNTNVNTTNDIILTSRTKSKPNYSYEWGRVSAVAMMGIESLLGNTTNILPYYEQYNQHVSKILLDQDPRFDPTIDIHAEPIFNPATNKIFSGKAARPQIHTAALRTIIRLNQLLWYVTFGQTSKAQYFYNNNNDQILSKQSVKGELEYLTRNWGMPSYDIWERCIGVHFYTLMVVRKAIYLGINMAIILHDDEFAAKMLQVANVINTKLPEFQDDRHNGIIFPSLEQRCLNDEQGRVEEYDIAVLLGTIHGRIEHETMSTMHNLVQHQLIKRNCEVNPHEWCVDIKSYSESWNFDTFFAWLEPRPYNANALYTLYLLEQWSMNEFPKVYEMARSKVNTTAIGRFINDHYKGFDSSAPTGNPWPLASFAASYVWNAMGQYLTAYPVGYNRDIKGSTSSIVFKKQHAKMWIKLIDYTIGMGYATPNSAHVALTNLRRELESGMEQKLSRSESSLALKALGRGCASLSDDHFSTPFIYLGLNGANLFEQINASTLVGTSGSFMTDNLAMAIIADNIHDTRSYPWK